MKDFGYDISDFRDVDPTFGTLKDLEDLVSKAHQLGVKVKRTPHNHDKRIFTVASQKIVINSHNTSSL